MKCIEEVEEHSFPPEEQSAGKHDPIKRKRNQQVEQQKIKRNVAQDILLFPPGGRGEGWIRSWEGGSREMIPRTQSNLQC